MTKGKLTVKKQVNPIQDMGDDPTASRIFCEALGQIPEMLVAVYKSCIGKGNVIKSRKFFRKRGRRGA